VVLPATKLLEASPTRPAAVIARPVELAGAAGPTQPAQSPLASTRQPDHGEDLSDRPRPERHPDHRAMESAFRPHDKDDELSLFTIARNLDQGRFRRVPAPRGRRLCMGLPRSADLPLWQLPHREAPPKVQP